MSQLCHENVRNSACSNMAPNLRHILLRLSRRPTCSTGYFDRLDRKSAGWVKEIMMSTYVPFQPRSSRFSSPYSSAHIWNHMIGARGVAIEHWAADATPPQGQPRRLRLVATGLAGITLDEVRNRAVHLQFDVSPAFLKAQDLSVRYTSLRNRPLEYVTKLKMWLFLSCFSVTVIWLKSSL